MRRAPPNSCSLLYIHIVPLDNNAIHFKTSYEGVSHVNCSYHNKVRNLFFNFKQTVSPPIRFNRLLFRL